jgi:hypothetical protein
LRLSIGQSGRIEGVSDAAPLCAAPRPRCARPAGKVECAGNVEDHEATMQTIRGFFWTATLAVAGAGIACAGTARAQEVPKAFTCTFTSGTASTYENGAFRSESPQPLGFKITNIDLDRQTASLVTDAHEKPGVLKIVRAINANHFLEVVNEGFLNLTTIYDEDPATGLYPAVHSRHFGIIGQPVFAQYAGTCRAE